MESLSSRELRDVLTEDNHAELLGRAAGMSQEGAQILALEFRPKPVPRDVVRTLNLPAVPVSVVSAETRPAPVPPQTVQPLTPQLRRLSVTVSAEFMAELEQARAVLSHKFPGSEFEQVVREGFRLVLEEQRKRKGMTERPRSPSRESANDRYVPAAVKRTVWERDHGQCAWPMGHGKICGSTQQLEFDHAVEVALGGRPAADNIQLLCKAHNLMKAERNLGRQLMAKFAGKRQLRLQV